MANYDHPAFVWGSASKNIQADSTAGDFHLISVDEVDVQAYWASWVNAFGALGSSGGGGGSGGSTQQSYPLVG